MRSYLHIKVLILILFFYGLADFKTSAQKMDYEGTNDSAPASSRFGLGFYAGLNNAFDYNQFAMNPGTSFMMYGTYKISSKWQIEIGFGGIYFKGKSLSFSQTRNVFDTIYKDNNTLTGIAYTTVPIIFRYKLSNASRLLIGMRWMCVSETYGNGTSGYYRPGTNDSFISRSKIIPGLPKGANNMDIGGIAGFEIVFLRHFSASLKINIGMIPVFPGKLSGVSGTMTGNTNNSIELGLNYEFISNMRP